jgi:hypothetical protein
VTEPEKKPKSNLVRLVDKSNDCRSLAPVDLVRDLLADLESGAVSAKQLMVVFWQEEDDSRVLHSRRACVSPADATHLLWAALSDISRELWR